MDLNGRISKFGVPGGRTNTKRGRWNRFFTLMPLVFLLMPPGLASAYKGSQTGQRRLRVRPNKPTVFLSLVSEVDSGIAISASESQKLLIELHNNTRWRLYYDQPLGQLQAGEDHLIYTIEDVEGKSVFVESAGDQFSRRSLQPGRSLLFRVP